MSRRRLLWSAAAVLLLCGVAAAYLWQAKDVRSWDDLRLRLASAARLYLGSERLPGQPRPYEGDLPSLAALNIRDAVLDKVHSGLLRPWAMEFLSANELLVSEFGGTLKRVDLATGRETTVAGLPPLPPARGQLGLLDVALHPGFADNGLIYFSHGQEDAASPGHYATAVSRGVLEGDRLHSVETIMVAKPSLPSLSNFGGALAFDGEGHLFVTVGDRSRDMQAQSKKSLNGKILRLTDTGAAAPGNPWESDPQVDPRVYAMGVRNPQGLAYDPGSGLLFETEHGPMGGDEVNIVEAGANYGWPVVSYGSNYNTQRKGVGTRRDDFKSPLYYYLPSIATSPLAVYRGNMFHEWQGHLLVGPLRPGPVSKLDQAAGQLRAEQRLLGELDSRIRDIKVAADGSIYLLTENGGRIYRLYRDPQNSALEQAEARSGKTIYQLSCAGCHSRGEGGAPAVKEPAAWRERLSRGREALYRAVIEGRGAMPPRGLCDNCSEQELRRATDYLLRRVGGAPGKAATLRDSRPNMVVIIADDLSWDDLGAYGNRSVRTPHIDQLARGGLRFDNAFLATSSCSASRASILTGRYPHSNGLAHLHHALPPTEQTLGALLQGAGYYTAAVGKWHIGREVKSQFSLVREDRADPGTRYWIESLRQRPKDQPFFFWLASRDPHRPHPEPGALPAYAYDPAQLDIPPDFVDGPGTRAGLAAYYAEVSRFDADVGAVLAELDRQGLRDDTLVIVMADNGRPFFRGKLKLYDYGLRTPLIAHWPARLPAGQTRTQLLSAIDLAPTLLELAGIDPPGNVQGQSFSRILLDDSAPGRTYIHAERNWHAGNAHERAVRSTRFFYKENQYPLQGDCFARGGLNAGPAFQEYARAYRERRLPYDASDCFAERRAPVELLAVGPDGQLSAENLAGKADYASVQQSLAQELARWRRDTGDFDFVPVNDPRGPRD